MKSIFVTVIDVRPLDGCEIDPKEYNGASVRCYIPSNNETEARQLLQSTLDNNHFELMEEEFFVQNDLVEWDNPNNTEAQECIDQALRSNEIIFSQFTGWGHDDPNAY